MFVFNRDFRHVSIYIYIYIYYIATEKYHWSVMGMALVPAALALIHCNLLVIFLGINIIRYIYSPLSSSCQVLQGFIFWI